jgi:hypothetical protein
MTIFTKIYFMDMHTGRQRRFPAVAIVAVLFLLCIIPGQALIANCWPGLSGRAGINPSLVFLDIPANLPVTIDMILVPGLFFLLYPFVILFYPSRPGISAGRQVVQRVGAVFAGLFALLFCMLSGGLLYFLVQDYLPMRVRNGIDSFGINADIHLPYPGYETIHLRGSAVLFMCFVIGMSICIRKIRKEPGMQKSVKLTREQRMTPYERMLREKQPPTGTAVTKTRTPAKSARTAATNSRTVTKNTRTATKNRNPVVIERQTARPDRNKFPHLCYSEPVMAFRPEAVAYMPVS